MGLTTERGGVNPSKDNIRDAWSAVDQPGANTFVYLAYSRESSEGTTSVSFELNHDNRLWDNGNAEIPCRRTGDLLISFEPEGNGIEILVQRWTTTRADTASGCAEVGTLSPAASLQPNVNAQAAQNAAAITNYLPGAYTSSVPAERFGEVALNLAQLVEDAFRDRCLSFSSVWMHSRSSSSVSSNMQDYVGPQPLSVKTCTASGTKFFDSNADGDRDPGERGIPRFQIWADYDDDGIKDANEPYSVSDNRGRYEIRDIRPPDGTYMLREQLLRRRSSALPVASDWQCSYPNDSTPGGTGSAPNGRFQCGWGAFNVNTTPNVRGRDFGNWFPARLIVEKRLFPSTDPGRFNLLIGDEVVVPAAGDRASGVRSVPPGTYTVSEQAVAGTDPAAYRSWVWCRGARLVRGIRSGTTDTVTLRAGQVAKCTFYNVRPGTPAIAIAKYGPEVATAGDTLQYRLVVTNPGEVPIPASAVDVVDEQCEPQPPELVSKEPATTPGTLDPGDEWTYRCSRDTRAPDDCEPTTVPNEASVSATVRGTTVSDDDGISTILLCPDNPVPPIPPTPGPPGPVVPPGPRPPDAGDAGRAGLVFQRAIQGCIGRRVPRLNLNGIRIASVRVYVNDRLIRGLTLRVLQRRHRPRVTLAPGQRYRLRVRVTFQLGTDSPPVTLIGRIRTCARPPVACPTAVRDEPGARAACAGIVRRWRRPT